jgi:aspartyl-tRNA(Asn)/glutamyl-tRNA(Gln) amidotransferase subunit C
MAKVDAQTIQNLTKLSRIECSEAEKAKLTKDLGSIIAYFDLLEELDTHDVKPCDHVIEGVSNVTREDIVGETLPRKVFLDNAPDQVGGMVRVPPVMKPS